MFKTWLFSVTSFTPISKTQIWFLATYKIVTLITWKWSMDNGVSCELQHYTTSRVLGNICFLKVTVTDMSLLFFFTFILLDQTFRNTLAKKVSFHFTIVFRVKICSISCSTYSGHCSFRYINRSVKICGIRPAKVTETAETNVTDRPPFNIMVYSS